MSKGPGYRLLEHTGDMGLEARAGSLAEAVESMARGLAALMFGASPAAEQVTGRITARGDDPAELLVDCLNEIVYWSERGNLVPAALRVESVAEGVLAATVTGEPFTPTRHGIERQVKSVTYHQACLEERPDGWYARVYVDL